MRPEDRDAAHHWDMLDAARAIQAFIENRTFADYAQDRMLRGAVERHLEIIGESARRVSEGFQRSHPETAWRPIIAQRNVLAHEYGEILNERIWAACEQHIPALVQALESAGIDEPPSTHS